MSDTSTDPSSTCRLQTCGKSFCFRPLHFSLHSHNFDSFAEAVLRCFLCPCGRHERICNACWLRSSCTHCVISRNVVSQCLLLTVKRLWKISDFKALTFVQIFGPCVGDCHHLVRCKDGLDFYEAMSIKVNTTGVCMYIYIYLWYHVLFIIHRYRVDTCSYHHTVRLAWDQVAEMSHVFALGSFGSHPGSPEERSFCILLRQAASIDSTFW